MSAILRAVKLHSRLANDTAETAASPSGLVFCHNTEVIWMPNGNPNKDDRESCFMAAALVGVPALAGRMDSCAAWLMCLVMLACAVLYDMWRRKR